MTDKIRLFMSIDLPDSVKVVLLDTAEQMGQQLPKRAVRWVKREQMHLTLRFLGDTAVTQLPALREQLTQVIVQHRPFRLRLNGVGAFPNRKRPRVVWMGLAGDLVGLQALQGALEETVVDLGWPREKRSFRPHLTLGRVKDTRQASALNWEVRLAEMEFGVTAVQLVQSDLRPSGAVYTVQHEAVLG